MKQKYIILKNSDKREITIREHMELEPGDYAFVCEETHAIKDIEAAAAQGAESLAEALRRPNMYPKQKVAVQIAQAVIDLLQRAPETEQTEICIDDATASHPGPTSIDSRIVNDEAASETKKPGIAFCEKAGRPEDV
ncbi:MAG: hypothetical protein JRH15_17070 [Deltaproteobacteria bacterium]|nr:hypothetical protein [Deltaproteobacteria bacterium]